MRQDMDKVIVERPRHGGGIRYPRGSVRGFRRVELDKRPRRQGMQRPWMHSGCKKNLNENLAPLRRYLLSNVGRPWDKVFSEMSQHMRLDSAVQLHIWQHVQDDVCFAARRAGRGAYVNSRNEPVREEFLVEVRSGLLRTNPQYRCGRGYQYFWPPPTPPPYEEAINIDGTRRYWKTRGIWYLVMLAPLPLHDRTGVWDVVEHKDGLGLGSDRRFYCVAKRQLNSKEIRRLPTRRDFVRVAL